MDLFEAMETQRAMRRLKPDPVPDHLIWKVLNAAIRAPSGSNVQPWNFIVIRDPEIKRRVAEYYRDGWGEMYGSRHEVMLADEANARIWRSVVYLAHHMAEVPVIILVTVRLHILDRLSAPGDSTPMGAHIFPAVQNLMLAARALGLGTTLTTAHRYHEAEIKELLGIPDGIETVALIPMGWPGGRFGPALRRPVERVTYWDRWGETRER